MPENQFEQVGEIVKEAVSLKKEDKLQQARQVLEAGLEDYPDHNFLKASLADLYTRLQRFQEASELAEEVLAADPGNYRGLTVKGMIAYRQRDYQEALDFFKQAYAGKKSGFIASTLIRTYLKLEKYSQALALCQEWQERKPDDVRFLKHKANVYEKMGKDKQAREIYDNYLEEEPEDKFAYKENIKLKLKDKEPAAAVRELRQLLKVGDRENNIHLHTLLAEELEKIEEYEEAVKEYKKALELKPGDQFVLKQLGFVLVEMDRREEALNYLKQAFRQDPSDYYVRSSLVSTFEKLGKYKEGIDYFKSIIKNNPSFKNLWGMVKKLSQKAGDTDDKKD